MSSQISGLYGSVAAAVFVLLPFTAFDEHIVLKRRTLRDLGQRAGVRKRSDLSESRLYIFRFQTKTHIYKLFSIRLNILFWSKLVVS